MWLQGLVADSDAGRRRCCVLCAVLCRWRSDSLTVIKTPPGIDSNKIVKNAYSRYNLSIGIGLSQVGRDAAGFVKEHVLGLSRQIGARGTYYLQQCTGLALTSLQRMYCLAIPACTLLACLLACLATRCAGRADPVCWTCCGGCWLWCCCQVNGKVFRIGHLGNMDELMMCSAISGAEMAMRDAGEWRLGL